MDKEPSLILNDIDETRVALAQKLERLEGQVRGTVESAKSTVEESLQNIKNGMEDTVNTVKQTLNPIYQTRKHPWGMLAGTITMGALIGHWWMRDSNRSFSETPTLLENRKSPPNVEFSGYRPGEPEEETESMEYQSWRHSEPARPGPSLARTYWNRLKQDFQEEIHMVRGIALGMAIKAAAKQVKEAFPQIAEDVERVVESADLKLGNTRKVSADSPPKMRMHI